jgi:hypothetical protein
MAVSSTSPIADYIKTTCTQIQAGLIKGAKFAGYIQFDIATVVELDKGGNLDIRVLNADAKISDFNTQRVSFVVNFPLESKKFNSVTIKGKSAKAKVHDEKIKKVMESPDIRAAAIKGKPAKVKAYDEKIKKVMAIRGAAIKSNKP